MLTCQIFALALDQDSNFALTFDKAVILHRFDLSAIPLLMYIFVRIMASICCKLVRICLYKVSTYVFVANGYLFRYIYGSRVPINNNMGSH